MLGNAQQDVWSEQCLWRMRHRHDLNESARRLKVTQRRVMYSRDIPVNQTCAQRLIALNTGKAEIFTGSHSPRRIYHFRRAPKEGTRHAIRGLPRTRLLQTTIKRLGFQRADGHALRIDRIEAANRIAHYHVAFGKARHPFVVTAQIRWDSIRREISQRLGSADDSIDILTGKAAGIFQKASLVR